jgi:uncharacterized protein DUF4340
MNESIRTLAYVCLGAVAAVAAFATRPKLDEVSAISKQIGNQLFPNFKDPTEAKSLEIKQFDEVTARSKSFMVAQGSDGMWRIPSHGNYPADAESQLKAVAETLSDLKIIAVQSEVATDHALHGVLDPDKADVGAAGVGTLIAMQDTKGNDLLRLIVGKEVAGAKNQRFVRKPSEEVIYITTIDLSKLPTEFDKWIEKDLLKISTFDVSRVTLKDYLLLQTQTGAMGLLPRMDAQLSYDSGKGEWTLDKMVLHSQRGSSEGGLKEHEELNKQKLDDLRNGLGDVKIVDVVRKPGDLGSSLKVSKDKLTPDQQDALRDYGFFPNQAADGTLDIYGANGEVQVDTKDGVQYVLRFGNIAPQAEISSTTSKASKDKAKGEEEQVKVNRYLFVMTQLAPSVLTPPQLEPEPAGPASETRPDDTSKKDGEPAKADNQKKDDQKADDQKTTVVDPQQAERERIKKENERKLNEYRDKKKKAETRVTELNARFADWYYVVSEDVYKKIRLVRSDIVKEAATAKDEGFGIDAFRKLEEEGLKEAPKKTP